MSVADIADHHQQTLIRVSDRATVQALKAWRQVDYDALDQSWVPVGESVTQAATSAQLAIARTADGYTDRVAADFQTGVEPSRLVPQALAGVDAKGRPVDGVLFGAVTTTKDATRAGLGRVRALEVGANYLATIMKTLIADAGRSSESVSSLGKGFTRYVRVINPGACSRCAILAGISSYREAFRRHPACKCTTCPMPEGEKTPAGFFESTDDYFESLSEAEQDRVFTKAGAQAIRDGASAQSVVSARRQAAGITVSRRGGARPNSGRRLQKMVVGVRPDGSPVLAYTTTEGATRGRFTGRVRLMPEEIYQVSRTPAEARVLLRDAGYLETPGLTPTQRAQQASTDRELADRLFRRAGYTLG